MSAAETTEIPDLDTLINAAENRSGESSGEVNHSDKGAFDPDEYAGVVQWYNEQSKNLQRHYEMHLEHQKQKLAEENEAGLLEALQQSLNNFESDHMSDFASLSSSLDNACAHLNPCSLESNSDGSEKQSMLKELLLSPFSENYSREIDSPEHVSGNLNKSVSLSPENCSPSHGVLSKKLKPFVELLKHMEAAENDTKTGKTAKSKQSGTRLVNTKRYMSKYATADKKDNPPKDLKSNAIGKRIVLHPMKNGNSIQNCKTLTFSLKPNSVAKFVNTNQTPDANPFSTLPHSTTSAKVTPIFSTTSPSLKTVTITSGKLAEKRAATPPVGDQLPLKKQCISTCTTSAGQSVDHDYCTSVQQSNINSAPVLTEPLKNSNDFTPPESPKSQKSASQKVLKWDDYLQQVRAGVRSAPNSPTNSPKVARGSARKPVNNFMVVSLQGSQIPPAIVVNSVAGKSKVNKNVPLPEPLRKTAIKQTFGLQEFDQYLTVLQKNLNPNTSKTTKIDPTSEKTNLANNTNDVKSENSNVDPDPFSATQSLAAMVQRQQCEVLQKNEKVASSSNPQVPKTLNVPQNIIKKTQKIVPTSGSSGQLLMIQVPVSSATAQRSCSRKISPVKAAISVSPSTSNNIPKVAQTSPTKPVSTVSSPTAQPAPTFKLMTSNKDGAEAKSLILSGVTGKLKDILTLMAEQQAKSKTENAKQEVVSNEQQLVTLQKLISCLSTQQSLKSDTAELSNPPQLDKPEKKPVVTQRKTAMNVPADSTLTPLVTNVRTLQGSKEENMNFLPKSEKIIDTVPSASEFSQNPGAEKNIEHCVSEISVVNTMPENTVFVGTPTDDKTNQTKISEPEPLIQTPLQSELVQETVSTSKPDNLVFAEKATEVVQPPPLPFVVADSSEKQVQDDTSEDTSPKFSMTRSMAAAEMLAADVIDDGTEEIMVYSKPEEKAGNLDANNSVIGTIEDNDPAVITLEEAMEKLEDDELLSQDNLRTTSLAAADNLFCKLPSYFLTGKLVGEQGKPKENIEGLKQRGMKNVLCDPLISSKGNDVEFNKLPHYFSSGKLSRPNSPRQNNQRSSSAKNICQSNDFAVKLQPVGSTNTQHLTPQGTPVNQAETYYSKLPSYYTYGRPHPAVKTFNDDVADAKDDTVTSETLAADKQRRHSKRKHKAKKQKKKQKRASKRDRTPEKILYSKLPSYYLSGRILSNHEKVKTQRLSPHRRSSVRSPSPHSMSYSSRSSRSRSRSRSPLRRSRSRRRYLSRSYSRSMSRSSSGSEGESQRSWRSERRSIRNRRERSFDRRSYDTSDEDRDEYIWRREREARRANTQHQDTMESERQRAMEERRVVYVGGVDDKISKQELRRKFLRFGNIETVSLHFRNDGDNYGFLTFQYTSDAFRAIEEGGNLGPGEPHYDLCFGGRRQFCKTVYEDLDSKVAKEEAKAKELNDFDALLQQAARRSLRR